MESRSINPLMRRRGCRDGLHLQLDFKRDVAQPGRASALGGRLKRCGWCNKRKKLTEFHRRGAGYQSVCKGCRKEYDANYFAANRQRLIENKRNYRNEIVQWLRKYKESHPCMDCEQYYPYYVMQFDHLPKFKKLYTIADQLTTSPKKLLKEIEKCDLVCANCHAVRSHKRRKKLRV